MSSPGQGGIVGVLDTPEGLGGSLATSGGGFPAAIHFWPMNEGTGTIFHDSIGGLNFSCPLVSWTSTPGVPGSTALFTTASPTLATAAAYDADLDFDGTHAWTYSAWIYPTTMGVLLGNLVPPSYPGGWEVGNLLLNTIGAFALINSGSAFTANYISTGFFYSNLYLVTFTYDGSNTAAGLQIYLNGVSQPATNYSATGTPPERSSQPFLMGARLDGSNPYGGGLSFVRVWNQVLTPTQISTLFTNGPQ